MTSNWSCSMGTIVGGTLVIPAGSNVVVDANGGYLQTLAAFTLNGTLDLEGSPLEAFLEESFSTIGGDAVLTIDNSAAPLGIAGSGTILFGASDSSVGSSDPRTGLANQIFVLGNALTLPASMNVVAGGADADDNPEFGILNGTIVNGGTINCIGIGELDLNGLIVNQGTIKVTGRLPQLERALSPIPERFRKQRGFLEIRVCRQSGSDSGNQRRHTFDQRGSI